MTTESDQKKIPPSAKKKVRGIVYVDADRCKGCGFCVEFCPPKVLVLSEEFNAKGYHPPRLIDPENCTGCDLCGMYCPDFAIFAVQLKLSAKPGDAAAQLESGKPQEVMAQEEHR
jgi:2-oxoglutarate ferredoxin oxidoreductase subunit delta